MGKPQKKHESFQCYKITCLQNGKAYIGIASNGLSARWRQHKHDAKNGANTPLHNAIRKYDPKSFLIEEIATAKSWEVICEIEIEMIKQHGTHVSKNKGYNVSSGGEGPYGVKRSVETRKKLSQLVKQQYLDNPEMIEVLREKSKQQMRNPENREKSRLGALKQWSDPQLSRNSRKALENYWNQENANEIRRENQKQVMAKPSARENLKRKAKNQMEDPANRELSRQGALKQWADSEFRKSRLGGNHPMARAVRIEGEEYPTIRIAAEAMGVTSTCIRSRIKRGVSGYEWATDQERPNKTDA
ncbi:MAG: GIY-YIG nuclease family protein [Candidatus Riflebacteria bacterium]|nr:GIY-YIG nuclease family protein [Candidatus Riflebacteria bacterium]